MKTGLLFIWVAAFIWRLLLFFLLYSFSINQNVRPSFIEVEFGEYKTGTQAEFSKVQNEEVATNPNPSDVQPEDPKPEEPEPVEEQQQTTKETTKPVDVPDQKEEVKEEEKPVSEAPKVREEGVDEAPPPKDIDEDGQASLF